MGPVLYHTSCLYIIDVTTLPYLCQNIFIIFTAYYDNILYWKYSSYYFLILYGVQIYILMYYWLTPFVSFSLTIDI
jgi:hypothetical protein